MTLGDADAVEQLRAALAVGCTAATHVVADPQAFGPADVAREIAAVVRDHEAAGTPHELVLLGNDAADTGDFQVGIRLAYELGWPVVNGVNTVTVADGEVTATGSGPDGHETFRLPLPAVVTVLEGGVEPRYPSVPGRMKAKKAPIEERRAHGRPGRTVPGPTRAAASVPVDRAGAGRGPGERTRGRRPLRAAGGARAMIVVLVEVTPAGEVVETSREAMTFARDLAAAGGGVPVDAVVVGHTHDALVGTLASYGARRVHALTGPAYESFSGAAWAAGLMAVRERAGAVVVTAAGTSRGNEVLAHVAARSGLPMAANVVSFSSLSPFTVTRQVVGGAALEEMSLSQRPAIFTLAGHAVEATPAATAGAGELVVETPDVADADLLARVVSTEEPEPDLSGTLKSARVVVGAGRGAGSAEGFDDLLELAELLDASLGVSRVVTSLGWRPHHEQVGQTGSRISPDLYIPCGISGAIQHWAGCSSAKVILAINTDPDAPMVTKATHAVIGDLHEIIPAVNAEIRRRRA